MATALDGDKMRRSAPFSIRRPIDWRAPAAVFLGVQYLFCIFVAWTFDYREPPPFGKYGSFFLVGVMVVGSMKLLSHMRDRPKHLLTHLRVQDWTRYRDFTIAVMMLWLQWVALTWAKAMLKLPAGMWADVPLAQFERTILGVDAWQLLPPSGVVMTAIYQLWAPTIIFGFCWRFYRRDERREASLLSIFLIIGLLGTIGQYLLPSGGPIFYERLGFGDRFAAIEWSPVIWRVSEYLWAAFSDNTIGFATGISAFPSIHVATAVWLAVAVGRVWAWIYPAIIFLGSIMTGFHYAIDGIAAALGAIVLYRISAWILSPTQAVSG